MHKTNGFFAFPAGRKLRVLDFRTPEDRLAVRDEDEREVHSPSIDRHIETYYDADRAGHDEERAAALRGMIDEMTAVYKLRGVPVFAHPPLPPQLVAAQVEDAVRKGSGEIVSKFLHLIESNNRPAVRLQLEAALASRGGLLGDSVLSRAHEDVPNSIESAGRWRGRDWVSGSVQTRRSGGPGLGVEGPQWHGARHAQLDEALDLGKTAGDAALDIESDRRLAQANGELVQLGFWPDWLWGADRKPKRQEPSNRLNIRYIASDNKGGRINSQRNFELDKPSTRGGYIIQEVTIIFRPRNPDGSLGSPRILFRFWEAWEVRPGQKSPSEKRGAANDSVRFERDRGDSRGGRVEILTRTVFYEGLRSLPSEFKRHPPKGQPGYDPSVDPAGNLLATSRPFRLRRDEYESATDPENIATYTDW